MGGFDAGHTGRGEIVVLGDSAVGSLFGHRVWQVDDDGWLTGHVFKARWTPGVNEARCLQVTRTGPTMMRPFFAYEFNAYDYSGDAPRLREGFTAKTCPGVATNDHGCGFYVRTGRHRYEASAFPLVRGVVECWGQVELGAKGFRASKARITALLKPTLSDEDRDDVKTKKAEIKHLEGAVSRMVNALYTEADIEAMEKLETRAEVCRQVIARKTKALKAWPKVVKRYPDAAVFDDEAEMLAWWPPTDLTRLLLEE